MRRSPGVALVASPLSGVPPCLTVRRNADGCKASTCVLTPHEGKLCLSKIICRRPQSYGRRSCAFVRSCVEEPQALGEHASGRNLRSIVEVAPRGWKPWKTCLWSKSTINCRARPRGWKPWKTCLWWKSTINCRGMSQGLKALGNMPLVEIYDQL